MKDNIIQTTNISDSFFSGDFVSQTVVVILFIASIISWAIIIEKYFKYRNIRSQILKFESIFWSGQVLDSLYDKLKTEYHNNPMVNIFISAMVEYKRRDSSSKDTTLVIGVKERISQSMHVVRNRELERLDSNLSFLATVGSSATFIGLFGTVWGIMHSFQSIALSNNTSLAVVAPGIAEALFATAVGLIAAIPASIFYNFFYSKSNAIANKLEDFSYELYNLLTRAIDEDR